MLKCNICSIILCQSNFFLFYSPVCSVAAAVIVVNPVCDCQKPPRRIGYMHRTCVATPQAYQIYMFMARFCPQLQRRSALSTPSLVLLTPMRTISCLNIFKTSSICPGVYYRLTTSKQQRMTCMMLSVWCVDPIKFQAVSLRRVHHGLLKPLSKLPNTSLQTGYLPGDWTSANVTPVFKKSDKHLPSNYFPISPTSLVVKTMEHQILNQRKLIEFLTEHQKVNPNQHDFRHSHSCQSHLLESVHQWANRCLDQGTSSHVVFLDFSKAFDILLLMTPLLAICT